MPEGDSIHRIATQLIPLVGKTLERVTTQGLVRDLAGRTVASVAAHGKHLVIELGDGAQLRMHLGMNGRFRRYDRHHGEAVLARMSPGRASLAIVVAHAVYLWLQAKTVEISQRRSPRRGMAVASLGQDILADDFDCRQAASRAAVHTARTIAEVLLDQRVASGIGNIYKCESLFVCGIDPRTLVGALSEAVLEPLYAAARELMVANLGPGARTTRDALAPSAPIRGDRYHVYSRAGRPCLRCGALIEGYQLGDPPRWTWSCPHCQVREHPTGVAR
ncbi:MAG: DNA-formamidopyrimidine glycosylase family protein [Kofleriaceae bacterium]